MSFFKQMNKGENQTEKDEVNNIPVLEERNKGSRLHNNRNKANMMRKVIPH